MPMDLNESVTVTMTRAEAATICIGLALAEGLMPNRKLEGRAAGIVEMLQGVAPTGVIARTLVER